MRGAITHIDIMASDIYLEFEDGSSLYTSFTQAKRLIKEGQPSSFTYSCADHEKSVAFLNSILHAYKTVGSQLVRNLKRRKPSE